MKRPCLTVSSLLLALLNLYSVLPTLSLPRKKLLMDNVNEQPFPGDVTISLSLAIPTKLIVEELTVATLQDVVTLQKLTQSHNPKVEVKIFQASGEYPALALQLTKAPTIMTKSFVKKYFSLETGEPVRVTAGNDDVALANCFYTGHVNGMNDTYVSISVCHGVNGLIEMLDKEYQISSEFLNEKIVHHLVESHVAGSKKMLNCGTEDNLHHILPMNKFRRSVRLPAGSNVWTRYIEIYAVADHSIYRRAGSIDDAITRVINILNYASGLYRELDIHLALVGVEIWNTGNQITYKAIANDTIDTESLLVDFNRYRRYNINFETPNDNGQLFSSEKFHGSLLGRASAFGVCTQTNSGGVTFDSFSPSWARVATTMAHELGHNLGLPHSDSDQYAGEDCSCLYTDNPMFTHCIMHSSTTYSNLPKLWSPCTKNALEELFTIYNMDHCLKNIPEKLVQVGSMPTCGNFFVEEGEECDCGPPGDCRSTCCDAQTCKLMSNATCATGACCNFDTCVLRPTSYLCRPIQDAECDLVEACSGVSEWCPDDTYKQDGTECSNQGDAYCYNGKCRSHNSQCQKIWPGQNAQKSKDPCYVELNNWSMPYGNCGWETVTEDYGNQTVDKIYKTCQTEEDKFCGLLHCIKDSPENLGTRIRNHLLALWSISNCIMSSFDVGYQVFDPGQVPNGAKCGENKMCVNSRCVDVPTISNDCYCNGRGVCNQFGECHCNIGWAPPFCDVVGLGGSNSSNPYIPPIIAWTSKFSLGLMIGAGIMLLIVVPLIILVICRTFNRCCTFHALHTSSLDCVSVTYLSTEPSSAANEKAEKSESFPSANMSSGSKSKPKKKASGSKDKKKNATDKKSNISADKKSSISAEKKSDISADKKSKISANKKSKAAVTKLDDLARHMR